MRTDQFLELLPLRTDGPAYLGLAHGIRGMVMDGRLATGSRLPSERMLADLLGVSRTTVTRAFGELVDGGWAVARQGSGTTVRLPVTDRTPTHSLVPTPGRDTIVLAAAAGLAPEGTADLVTKALDWLPTTLASAGYEPYGAEHLREQLAAWYAARGVPTRADQIVVTAGALLAVSVAFHALAGPGDRVAVDSPTYPGALGATAAARARAVPVALDGRWDLGAWTEAIRRSRPRLAYLIPDFHNPTGLLMPTDERARLAALLSDGAVVPIVDETPAELDFEESAAAVPFAAVSDDAVSIGSLSKVLWGGLRIGWLRCPPRLVDAVTRQAEALSLGPSALDQLVAAAYFDNPSSIRRAVVARLRRARTGWREALAERLPDWEVPNPSGGLGLWVRLPARLSTELALAGRSHGLTMAPGPRFSTDRTHANRLRLPLTLPPEIIGEATSRLVSAWAEVRHGVASEVRLESLTL